MAAEAAAGGAPGERSALLVVDVQNDFCPGGSLPVSDGDSVVPVLNDYAARFAREGLPVIYSRDWHPAETTHFQTRGGPWPPHCVQGTYGAEFHPDLRLPAGAIVVSKGMGPAEDGYSAFVGRDAHGQKLESVLRELGVQRLVVGGLATDYCVLNSVLEALEAGLKVEVLCRGIRGVDLQPGDSARALEQMRSAGASLIED